MADLYNALVMWAVITLPLAVCFWVWFKLCNMFRR